MRDPTFWPLGLRGRTAVELGVLAVLTGLYLHLWPHRPPGVDPGLALVGLGLVALRGRQTTRRVWGAPAGPPLDRLRRGFIAMTCFTAPVLLAFAVYGGWDAYSARGQWPDVFRRLFAPRFFLTFAVYVPWALVQQTLFQGYLLARLKALAPSASPIALAAVNGLLYGAVHVPHWDVALVTVAAGLVWTFAYQRTRSVVPIAVSHAVLGSAYFYWVRDTDAVRIFWLALATPLGWS